MNPWTRMHLSCDNFKVKCTSTCARDVNNRLHVIPPRGAPGFCLEVDNARDAFCPQSGPMQAVNPRPPVSSPVRAVFISNISTAHRGRATGCYPQIRCMHGIYSCPRVWTPVHAIFRFAAKMPPGPHARSPVQAIVRLQATNGGPRVAFYWSGEKNGRPHWINEMETAVECKVNLFVHFQSHSNWL